MNTLPFLASITATVGVPATNWDAPGIIFLKFLAVVFLVLLNGFFVASEFAIVKVRASPQRPFTVSAVCWMAARLMFSILRQLAAERTSGAGDKRLLRNREYF